MVIATLIIIITIIQITLQEHLKVAIAITIIILIQEHSKEPITTTATQILTPIPRVHQPQTAPVHL